MHVYHGTTAAHAENFIEQGIDAHVLHPRQIHGPQDEVPGLFVTPRLPIARRFGLYILEITVAPEQLKVPPAFCLAGAITLEESIKNQAEPQALLVGRIEPECVRLIESYPNGHPFNPFDEEAWR